MGDLTGTLRRHPIVGIDTAPFIYHIEGSSEFAPSAAMAMDGLARGDFAGVTSVLTLMEIAVRPLQVGHPEMADEYEVLLSNYPNLTVVAIDAGVARRAAELRAQHRIRPADSLQLAACIVSGATAFLTNDDALRRVTELQILVLGDFIA